MDPVTGIAFALGAGSFLFDVFDKTVQAYGLYSTSKSFANVSAHLVAKLLIEERRLIQWGDGVGIRPVAKPAEGKTLELDDRLRENEALYQTILQALAGIEATLTDVDILTAKYGLQIFEERSPPDENSPKNEIMLPLRPQRSPPGLVSRDDHDDHDDHPGLSETLKTTRDRSRRIKASTSVGKKFQWAIKDKSGFEMLLDRLRYYNDSLYCLLPKESINTITRDVLANLIDAATSERLLQFTAMASPSLRCNFQDNFAASQYTTIASAAMTSLQIAGVDLSPPLNVWINEASISYDGEVSCLGTFSRQECAPARVFVEKKMSINYADYNEDGLTRKATLERVRELALLLREPRHFGFATMPCLGIITDLNDKSLLRAGEVKPVYELPVAADPLAHPVSLHDLLFLEEYRSEEPPEINVRFQLVKSLANALHEMHCTEWLHRNISSKVIFFLKTKPGSGIESFDLEKPYMAGFDAARSFKAHGCLPYRRWDHDALAYKHPGYLLYHHWSQSNAERGNTGDKLFYMPRHDYYSMGLVFLEIGMWRSLRSFLLCDVPFFDDSCKPSDPECTFGERFESLTLEMLFTRQNMVIDSGPVTEEERSRQAHILAAYVAEGLKLVEEEGLIDFVLDEDNLDDYSTSGTWAAWDMAYGPYKLREDAIRVCLEKLGSRMGRRYREAVRRCLASDLGVSPRSAKNLDWLRAFNWRVVQELNKCCA